MTLKQPVDFAKVEELRREMLLTMKDMSELFGVSRMTYHSWVQGKSLRPSNDEQVRIALRRLLAVYTGHGWPSAQVRAMDSKQRALHLKQLLEADK